MAKWLNQSILKLRLLAIAVAMGLWGKPLAYADIRDLELCGRRVPNDW
jgi:hypothetical protein